MSLDKEKELRILALVKLKEKLDKEIDKFMLDYYVDMSYIRGLFKQPSKD